MKYSNLFVKTTKDINKEADNRGTQLLMQAGFVHKTMAGVYSYLPLGLKVLHNIEAVVREHMDRLGASELLMSALSPQENRIKTGRWENFDALFKLPSATGKDYALNPTHEELITPIAKEYVQSYKDLPFSTYQFQNKFRNESRAKSGVLRWREFLMKDQYSFHTDQKCLDEFYEEVKEAYMEIFTDLGIGDITVPVFASGGAFTKFSDEFQTFCEIGEDEIFVCKDCKVAHNREIVDASNFKCVKCASSNYELKKASEVGNIFKLGTKFSDAFDLTYVDQKNEHQPVYMGCYGIGISRMMGILAEIKNDEQGLLWPEKVAPFTIYLINIGEDLSAEMFYKQLTAQGIDVLWDDREDVRPGQKFADSDLMGIPYRVVISEKTIAAGGVEVKKRGEEEARIVKEGESIC